jgi:FkbM family methyltransferase
MDILQEEETPREILYKVGNFEISLTSDHSLPRNQVAHQLYDVFPRFLASALGVGSSFVQIGANVGDTVALMYSHNPSLRSLCIEADEEFFLLLKKNLVQIQSSIGCEYKAVHKLIASKLVFSSLEGDSGTKKAILANENEVLLPTMTLDDVIIDSGEKTIDLIMVDTDGYDFDVIESGWNSIKTNEPLIYFEVTTNSVDNIQSYLDTIEKLEELGYKDWTIFDNFGNLMCKLGKKELINQLADYSLWQNLGVGSRTIYYIDILCSTPKRRNVHEQALSDYLAFLKTVVKRAI